MDAGCKGFLRDVAIYFRDFLETDFHKRRLPKRSVQLRNQDNLLVGIKLDKYPAFVEIVWKLIRGGFSRSILKQISKGSYRALIPASLVALVEAQLKRVSSETLDSIATTLAKEARRLGKAHKEEYDRAVEALLSIAGTLVNAQVVKPLVSSLAKPLANLAVSDENLTYLLEEELTAVLVRPLDEIIAIIVREIIAGEEADAEARFATQLQLEEVRGTIKGFFETYQAADLYLELFELVRNKGMLEGQDVYLYFGEISYSNTRFPLFYIPIDLLRERETLVVEFDPHVFINKKALDFIVQEYCRETEKKGSLSSVTERIIYLSNQGDGFQILVQEVFNELISYFAADAKIDIGSAKSQIAKSKFINISNATSFALFEKSDEAVINDYEEILRQLALDESELGGAFERIIQDFLEKEPVSFMSNVHDEWDATSTDDKLVASSPIALNEEQRQILIAVKRDGCNYITVQGPPGTGKSHTITAIVCDAVLNNKSVLVLSDKKEALDVVEDKITETLNRVRHDKNFQNPILRLGKTGSTYAQILSSAAITSINDAYRALKSKHGELEKNITSSIASLKEEIEAEILSGGDISLDEISELLDSEVCMSDKPLLWDTEELSRHVAAPGDLDELRRIVIDLCETLGADGGNIPNSFPRLCFDMGLKPTGDVRVLSRFGQHCGMLLVGVAKLNDHYDTDKLLEQFGGMEDNKIEPLKGIHTDFVALKAEFLGSLKWWRKNTINARFRTLFPNSTLTKAHGSLPIIARTLEMLNKAFLIKAAIPATDKPYDFAATLWSVVHDSEFHGEMERFARLTDDLHYIEERIKIYPVTLKKLGIQEVSITSLCRSKLAAMPQAEFDELVGYIALRQRLEQKFRGLGTVGYAARKRQIEKLITMEMTYRLDGRVIDFYQNNQATAKSLRTIIQKKRRFPKDEFEKLKNAFPCILSGIRDYAEYIPLQADIFDLVIIDEASQVSISQAFPALLRARKVLVLGDKKQFSNVKAAHARSETNNEYLNHLRASFIACVSSDEGKLIRIENFNIRTSILEFFEFINNFTIQLNKYFRGYREIISYSNRYFYKNSLQVMKIRGNIIDDVLAFSFIDHDGKNEPVANTNRPEIDFITTELLRLKAVGFKGTAGIITPHTNQQKLIMEAINRLSERDWLYDNLRLKIMTFDTCQGEERDIIYYSMVANPAIDRLWGIFVKDLEKVDVEENGKIKAQRLNVGFSRAKETMHFVLSKPLDQYSGSIGIALRHYWEERRVAQQEPTSEDVDPKSPMEREVLGWILNTSLWQENRASGSISLIPQFNIGRYLNQLDRTHTYKHPEYKVDFLLTYRDPAGSKHRIIIEYDGFKEHFINHEWVLAHNYNQYYSEEDVYRQKTIEGYGYKFLRINRFNIGKDPVVTLEKRLRAQIEERDETNWVLSGVLETIDGLRTNEVKECPKCKELRDIDEFRDPSLIKGIGRICITCKGMKKETLQKASGLSAQPTKTKCPKCGSNMVLRRGKFGQFYGCSQFPRCRGTKNYNKVQTVEDRSTHLDKSDLVSVSAEPIKTKTEPKSDELHKPYLKDESLNIYVEVCKNKSSEKYFIVKKDINNNKATMILPSGEEMTLKKSLFDELEEYKLSVLIADNLITQEQLSAYKKYINDDATNPPIVLTKEPAYLKSYREELNNPNSLPSRMLYHVREARKITWTDLKDVLTDKYGYRDSGSYSASLRVLYIDGYIKIDGKGDNKFISSS